MKKNNTLYTICFLLAGMCINSACEDILSESPNSSYERKDQRCAGGHGCIGNLQRAARHLWR